MTEDDWLAGKAADEMLDAVADRLTPRRWRLLGAACVRKLGDLLAPGPLKDAVEFAELADPLAPADADAWRDRVAAATDAAAEYQREAIRELVRSVEALAADDPDTPPTYPSEVLHRAAVGFAAGAGRTVAEAVTYAAEAVGRLFAPPSREEFDLLSEAVQQADGFNTQARQGVVNARNMADRGDEFADNYNPKTVRRDMAVAEEVVRKLEQGADDDGGRREKAYNRQLARFLFELTGNPFREYRFDPRWRTGTVLDLARTIRDDRAFDRMPILADALLDADCDEEAVLRHCRGTEKHAADKPQHLRGCWVLDLILAPDDPLFTAGPVVVKKRKPRGDWWH